MRNGRAFVRDGSLDRRTMPPTLSPQPSASCLEIRIDGGGSTRADCVKVVTRVAMSAIVSMSMSQIAKRCILQVYRHVDAIRKVEAHRRRHPERGRVRHS